MFWRHIDIKNFDLEAPLTKSSRKYIKIFRTFAERPSISCAFDEIASCVFEGCNFSKNNNNNNNNNNDNNNNDNNIPKAVSTRVGKELERPYIKKDLIWYV